MKKISLFILALALFIIQCTFSLAESQKIKSTVGNIYVTKVKNAGKVQAIQSFYEGKAGFFTKEGWGVVDTQGRIIIPPQYHGITCYSEGVIGAQLGTSWFLLDAQGNRISDATYLDLANGFSEGLCAAKKNGKWGFIDPSGEFVLEPVWESAHNFREGVAAVKLYGKWGYIDTTGEYVIDRKWTRGTNNTTGTMNGSELGDVAGTGSYGAPDDVGDFYDGLAAVMSDGKTAFINHKGEIVIPYRDYESVGFNEGIALVMKRNTGTGYIDTSGKYIIDMHSKWNGSCALFSEGVAPIQEITSKGLFDSSAKAYYIDTNGKRTGNRNWEYTASVREGIGIGIKGERKYYIDKKGEPIMSNQKYELAMQFHEGHALAVDAGKGLVVLSLQEPVNSSEPATAASGKSGNNGQNNAASSSRIRITGNGHINVRSEPNTQSPRVGTVKSGDVFDYLSISEEGWYEIKLSNGKTGFVSPKLAKEI